MPSEEPTLLEHMTRIGSIQTVKKHRAQVENLKKAREARERKRRGSMMGKVSATAKVCRFGPHVPRKPRQISVTIGGVQKMVEVLEK